MVGWTREPGHATAAYIQIRVAGQQPLYPWSMGMFDYYEPSKEFVCGECGMPLKDWQGKDGPNAMFVWRQGEAAPVDQPVVEESKIDPKKRAAFRLPATFRLYGWCDQGHMTEATGRCDGEVWTDTEVASAPTQWTPGLDPPDRLP